MSVLFLEFVLRSHIPSFKVPHIVRVPQCLRDNYPFRLASMSRVDDSASVSLLEYLDLSQLNCLNESSEHTLESILKHKSKNNSPDCYLQSDADEQLILNIPFNQTVRVRSIVIQGSLADEAPKDLKLAVNRLNLGFDDVQDAEEPDVAQVLFLDPANVHNSSQPIPLRFVRFQTVNSLHIFVHSNQGGAEYTRIDSIDILGFPVETTKDLSGLKSDKQ